MVSIIRHEDASCNASMKMGKRMQSANAASSPATLRVLVGQYIYVTLRVAWYSLLR